MSAPPNILDALKADLGIPDTEDAWLQRRVDGVWARMQVYTSRDLAVPPGQFIDDWGEIAVADPQQPLPPALWFAPRASVFLRCFPVVSIDAITIDGSVIDAAGTHFDWRTGKLFTLGQTQYAEDLSGRLRCSRAQITYTAGWAECPADLYEVVQGAIGVLWNSRQGQSSGTGGGTITGINAIDVGSIEIAPGNAFVNATLKGAGTNDPLLGPYVNMLDHYVDERVRIGHALMPTTRPAGASQ
jgi:hypothetical protein